MGAILEVKDLSISFAGIRRYSISIFLLSGGKYWALSDPTVPESPPR